MIGISLGFLMWTMKFRDYMSAVAIAPLLFLTYAVMSLNSDPVLSWSESNCLVVPMNSTATVSGNTTTTLYGNDVVCAPAPVNHDLSPQALTNINSAMLVGLITVFFVIGKRMLDFRAKKPGD